MRILVTGAAGLLGSEVAGRLQERGHRVTGLVHKSTRLVRSGGRTVDGIALVQGDVALPGLGLARDAHARLAAGNDLIVHCAAVTQFSAPEEAYRRVNVGGTANVLELARRQGVPLLHVSTAFVCGGSDGEIGESDAPARGGFANGYEASKAAGERLVEAARSERLRVAVARPSIVMGDHATGATQQFCDVYRFIRLIAEGQIRALPVAPHATLDFVPADHVARGIVAIAEAMDEAAGRTFHLVSGAPVPVAAFTGAIGAVPGCSAARLVPPEAFRAERLPRSEQRWHNSVTSLYAHYLQRAPRFRDDNLRALAGFGCPPVDADYFERLLSFAIRSGFVRPTRLAA
jgi:nucleoside-diphosphate-sugar epimerase